MSRSGYSEECDNLNSPYRNGVTMGAKRLCVVCRVRPPEVPDRERMGRPIKRVCRQCHGKRLHGDMDAIMNAANKRKGGNGE